MKLPTDEQTETDRQTDRQKDKQTNAVALLNLFGGDKKIENLGSL